MKSICKKISALLLIIIMLTSVSFNVMSYSEIVDGEYLEEIETLPDEDEEHLEDIQTLPDEDEEEHLEDIQTLPDEDEYEHLEDIQTLPDEDEYEHLEDIQTLPDKSYYDLMITNRNNTQQAYKANAVAKNINKGDSSDYDVLLTQDQDGQYYYCMEKGGALMLYTNGGATLREFYYRATQYKSITVEQSLVLAYLNAKELTEIEGISLNTNNNREKIIQYYIWKTGINQGNTNISVPSIYANIISKLQKSINNEIKIGNDIINIKDKTITINGTEYELENFEAYKYTSKLIYRRDNGKGYIENNYSGCGQEIFGFFSELKRKDTDEPDTPNIQLHKTNEDNVGLNGAVFSIYDRETGKLIEQYETIKDGYTDSIPVEYEKEYIIKETDAPDGYELSTEFVILTIFGDEDSAQYIVYDENGNIIEDGHWSEDEISLDYLIILTLEDEKDETPPTPTIPPTPDIPNTPDTTPNIEEAYPLLMYIKGTVFLDGIEGKESIADGYYNKENSTDKGLAGIKVEIYDASTNKLATFATKEALTTRKENNRTYIIENVDFDALNKYGKATTYTDENGFYEFYGLNPSHTYYIVFTYNGMRYVEIKTTTETGIDVSGYDIKLENASKATEVDRKEKIIDVFSEIGTYPYNYYSKSKGGYNIAYNQDDVEEAMKNGLSKCGNNYETLYNNLSKYMDETMAYFIKDCQVTARIDGLGNILKDAEQKVKEYNGSIKSNTGNMIYPVVETHNYPNINQVQFTKNYGYTIYRFYADPIPGTVNGETVIVGYTEPYWHNAGTGSVGTLTYDERIDGEWTSVSSKFIQQDQELTNALNQLIAQSNDSVKYEANITGTWLELKEGYTSETIKDVQWAVFDLKNQQYLNGWYDKCKSVSYKDEYKMLTDNLKTLNEDITTNLPCANLGLQYRSTFDMALYDDVLKAEVTINGVLGNYDYDKRAANGKAFSFGVNESDLRAYYTNLTNGNVEAIRNLKYNTSISSTDEYINYARTTDIHYSSDVPKTDNGIAQAGGYDDNNNSIYLTYRIRIINQSSIKGTITEVVDYYKNDFEVVKVYDKDNNEYSFSNSSIYANRGTKNDNVEGYDKVYITLDNKELANNESIELFMILKMKDIPNTLTEEVLNSEEGYKTLNLAEINGYKTTNGYIDIDSMPGNVVETNRFAEGKYEDDESKSPTLIFKNPNTEGRTISGIIFEDVVTGEILNKDTTRQSLANHQFDENDTLIEGATVQLIQILADGTEKLSAQTQTVNGSYKFTNIRPGNYVIRFAYGNTDKTALTTKNIVDDEGNTLSMPNEKSYNGESFENTEKLSNTTFGANGYWYTDSDIETNTRYSDAVDDKVRREEVTNNFKTIINENAEILNSYKDSKVNRSLVTKLKEQAYMFATTDVMKLEMEYVGTKNENTNGNTTTANEDGKYNYVYDITNVDFGIVERSRAQLDLIKKVSYISLVDSTGKEISGGTYEDWKNGNVKYVRWIMGEDGFVDMEIDKELINGATLKITYDITVKDNSEAGNEISDIVVIDYVTNNINYGAGYINNEGNTNSFYGWETTTTDDLINIDKYVNSKSALNTEDDINKIDLSTYQTIVKATFKPGETKKLTLEKNLSPEEDSNFNYENRAEIVSSTNTKGRGDYSSIYGNLDPMTYTSRQGNLYWDFIKGVTSSSDNDTDSITENTGVNPIRIAEPDSASAEETIVSPPEGTTGIVISGEYFIFGLTLLISFVIGLMLIKKYKELEA